VRVRGRFALVRGVYLWVLVCALLLGLGSTTLAQGKSQQQARTPLLQGRLQPAPASFQPTQTSTQPVQTSTQPTPTGTEPTPTSTEQTSTEPTPNSPQSPPDSGTSTVSDVLFPWVDSGGFDDNWTEGLGLAGLGVLGALVTVYLFIGGFLPSMGGKADYDALGIEIEDLEGRRDKEIGLREVYSRGESEISADRRDEASRLAGEFSEIIDQKRAERSALRRELFAVGFPVYVVIGGAFAVLFSENALQAILIGFGWTAIADRIGLKRELDKKSERRDEEIATLTKEADAREKAEAKLAATEKDLAEAKRTLGSTNDQLTSAITDNRRKISND
jgi:hypothetical protein